jgi:hypothetical protein
VLGITSFSIDATTPVPNGKTQVHMEFAYDGGGMGKGGTVTLYYDGKEVGTGRVDQTAIALTKSFLGSVRRASTAGNRSSSRGCRSMREIAGERSHHRLSANL